MPKGLPPPSSLASQRVRAFCLDTSVIEAAGFRFDSGPIRHLSGQLPPWMRLWMPEVVRREVFAHRMASVDRAIQQLRGGASELRRHIGGDFDPQLPMWVEGAERVARETFGAQLDSFLKSHDGEIIDLTHPALARTMFDRYFSKRPPFGGATKKHEFPDAACLVGMSLKAEEQKVEVILVSKDDGWAAYAEQASSLYCVPDLQSLAALYVSTSAESKAVRDKISRSLSPISHALRQQIVAVVQTGLRATEWRLRTPYSHVLDIDAGVVDVRLVDAVPNPDAVGVWMAGTSGDRCVVEIGVDVEAVISAEVIAYEHWPHGVKKDLARSEPDLPFHGEVKLTLEVVGNLTDGDLWAHVSRLELRDVPMEITVAANDLHGDFDELLKTRRWWSIDGDLDDDIPF